MCRNHNLGHNWVDSMWEANETAASSQESFGLRAIISPFRWAHVLGTLGKDLNINDSHVVTGTRLSRERFGKKEQERARFSFH